MNESNPFKYDPSKMPANSYEAHRERQQYKHIRTPQISRPSGKMMSEEEQRAYHEELEKSARERDQFEEQWKNKIEEKFEYEQKVRWAIKRTMRNEEEEGDADIIAEAKERGAYQDIYNDYISDLELNNRDWTGAYY